MAHLSSAATATKKRKRESSKLEDRTRLKTKSKKNTATSKEDDPQAAILLLETQILESRRNYNNITTLISTIKQKDAKEETVVFTVVALCRIFCRLMTAGCFVKSKGTPEAEIVIIQWLKERYQEYVDILLVDFLRSDTASKQNIAFTLLMRLIEQESKSEGEYSWRKGLLASLVEVLLLLPEDDPIRQEYAEKYMKTYDDLRFYTLQSIAACFTGDHDSATQELITANSTSLLSTLDKPPESSDALETFYGQRPAQQKHQLYSVTAHKRQAQEAWLATLRSDLSKDQRKVVLGIFTSQIAPWFLQVEVLMDFLTDSFDVGGATSLLALSGLFYLIQEKNLDYPSFYHKLYSLLNAGLLHSKHRSRFFRLLETFMSSTHLPAALVASFIKRLSRLALHGPPAGIVAVVPWIYNMFKRHPTCTFMIHREIRDPDERKDLEEEGMDDPFDMEEEDPMQTGAIESSLWEIETQAIIQPRRFPRSILYGGMLTLDPAQLTN